MSISKLGPQRYRIRLMVKGLTADEVYNGPRSGALARQDAIKRELTERAAALSSPTVAAFWRDFMESCEQKGLVPSTIEGYAKDYRNHVEPALGRVRLAEVTPRMVSALLSSKSAGTARHVRALLSAMFSLAEERELVEQSVMRRKYTMPSGVARRANTDVMDMETMQAVADACQGEPWEAMFLLIAFAGLRREEAAGARCEDVRVHNGAVVVDVRHTVQVVRGKIVVGGGKTDESRRTAVMVSHGWRLLELADGEGWISGDGEEPPNPDRLAKKYEGWFKSQPFSYVPMKNLRTSFSTSMTAAGMDAAMVGKLTGHRSMDVQYRHYLKPSVDDYIGSLPPAFAMDLTYGPGGDLPREP